MNPIKLLTLTSIAAFFVGCASDDNTYTRNSSREPGIAIPGGGGPVYGEGEFEGGLPPAEQIQMASVTIQPFLVN